MTTTGIKAIKLAIHPRHNIKLPLDIIFKIMQTNIDTPLIKYNPMTGQDKLYRLYTNALTKDGVKIPMLPPSIIFKLVNEIGKSKSVTFYIIYEKYAILCEFNSNGDIILSSTFDSFSLDEISELFKNAVNPIILKIKEFLEKNGYKFYLFNHVTDSNIEILNINYHSEININKAISIDKFKKCIGNIFAIEENSQDDITLRFKRVSDYTEINSQNALVTSLLKNNASPRIIVEKLINAYDISHNDAAEIVSRIINERTELVKTHKKAKIIRLEPGFEIFIKINRQKKTVSVNVNGINNLLYLQTLPIYIDTLIRLTQNPLSTTFPYDIIQNLCNIDIKPKNMYVKPKVEEEEEADVKEEEAELGEAGVDEKEEEELGEAGAELGEEEKEEEAELGEEEKEEDAELGEATAEEDDIDDDVSDIYVSDSESDSDESLEGGGESDDDDDDDDESQYVSDEENDGVDEERDNGGDEEEVGELITEGNEAELGAEDEVEEESMVQNLNNIRLKTPYFVQTRLLERDPTLFNNPGYTRTCQSERKRQPIVLSKRELAAYNKKYPGALNNKNTLEYGKDSSNQSNYYICPRYWNFKTNQPMTEEQVKQNSEENNILEDNASKVTENKYIYEFYHKMLHGTKENYKQLYPGFVKSKKTNEQCLPCCFTKQQKNVEKCSKSKRIVSFA